ncbi:MAG: hypothetical protein Q8R79_00955 [Legionellaceae bacterium]|nr:hypothetical protein [Legionellaceae bacterium]
MRNQEKPAVPPKFPEPTPPQEFPTEPDSYEPNFPDTPESPPSQQPEPQEE